MDKLILNYEKICFISFFFLKLFVEKIYQNNHNIHSPGVIKLYINFINYYII